MSEQIMWGNCRTQRFVRNWKRRLGTHDIEHEVSGIYDVAHGAGLAVLFPAWMKYVYRHDINRLLNMQLGYGMLSLTFQS